MVKRIVDLFCIESERVVGSAYGGIRIIFSLGDLYSAECCVLLSTDESRFNDFPIDQPRF